MSLVFNGLRLVAVYRSFCLLRLAVARRRPGLDGAATHLVSLFSQEKIRYARENAAALQHSRRALPLADCYGDRSHAAQRFALRGRALRDR